MGQVQQKIAVTILPEDFGANEQEVKDCLAGLAAHDELCRERGDFDGWVKNRISDAMDAARKVGKEIREAQEAVDAEKSHNAHLDGLAEFYGMSAGEVRERMELSLAGKAESKKKK